MGLIEMVLTVCALALPAQCEEQHLHFTADMSINQCVMRAQPYIAQWISEHPKWVAMIGSDYGRNVARKSHTGIIATLAPEETPAPARPRIRLPADAPA